MVRAGPSAATPAHLAAPGRLAARVRVAAALAGLAVATGALAVAAGPGRSTTYAGSSAAGTALTVCAGLGLIAAGLVIRLARRQARPPAGGGGLRRGAAHGGRAGAVPRPLLRPGLPGELHRQQLPRPAAAVAGPRRGGRRPLVHRRDRKS